MPQFPKPWFRSSTRKWYVQLQGRQIDLGFNREEAFRTYYELMREPGEAVQVTSRTVVGVLDLFLDWCKANRAEGTYEWYQERAESFAKTIPHKLLVTELKPFHIEAWLSKHRNWNPGNRRGAMLAIQRSMNWAVKMGHIDRTPLFGLEKPPQGRRETVIEPAEFERILSAIQNQDFADLLTVCWETGCRAQEVLRVEACHVDLTQQRWVLPIQKSKGKKRNCVVYFSPKAFAILKRLVEKYPQGALFRNSDGNAWNPNAVGCVFGRLKKKLGVRYCLTNFRHSWVTRKLKSGINSVTVAVLANHVDCTMISRVYQHISQDPAYLLKAAGV